MAAAEATNLAHYNFDNSWDIFDNHMPNNIIPGFSIFKWIAVAWQECQNTKPLVSAMLVTRHTLLFESTLWDVKLESTRHAIIAALPFHADGCEVKYRGRGW